MLQNLFHLSTMITGKFHSHITIQPDDREKAESAARLTNGKITFIDLAGSKHAQTDYMITHHYVTGHRNLVDSLDVTALLMARTNAIDEFGIKVVRVKLEHEIRDPHTPQDCVTESIESGVYTEVHVRMREQRRDYPGWSYSVNALGKSDEYFLTRRFRAADDMSRILNCIPSHGVIEVKYEVALLDTNPKLDEWWCAGMSR